MMTYAIFVRLKFQNVTNYLFMNSIKNKRELILSLIKDDLTNFKLVYSLKSKKHGKLTTDVLKTIRGFEQLSDDKLEKLNENLNELARIILIHLSNLNRQQNGNGY